MHEGMTQISKSAWLSAIPAIFVLLWSTGFVGALYAMPYAHPFGFLSLRFVLCIILIGGYCVLTRAEWPRGEALWAALVTGALIHGIYLGAVFWAIKHGFPSGFAGLVVGLQPVVTMLLAGLLLGERVSIRQTAGFAIGLLGVVMVFWPRLGGELGGDFIRNGLVVFMGVVAISLGTVMQKRFGGKGNLAAGTAVQYVGALMLSGVIVLFFEPLEMEWTGSLIFALVWLVLVLSVGAIVLLMVMIRAGEVSRVASLFYLVPAVTAVLAYFLFGETLNLIQVGGIVVASAGVALATMRRRPAPPPL